LSRRIKIKHNYLNNKDILKEIHRSKNSYCTFLKPEYADYDIILHHINDINQSSITQAKSNRSERLAKLALEQAVANGEKKKLDDFLVEIEDISNSDIVIRVMSWDHIPVAESKKQEPELIDDSLTYTEYDDLENPKSGTATVKYVKCNFPPFQHYKLDEKNSPYCVGKSHWQGDLETGNWSRDHGQMTKTLALMFMKLCERYATRSNWRGYTYNDEMRSQALLQLSQIGLQFDESKSQNPFAYYTAAITNSFTRVLNIEKRNQNLRDDILEMNNFNPSYTRQGLLGGSQYEIDHE